MLIKLNLDELTKSTAPSIMNEKNEIPNIYATSGFGILSLYFLYLELLFLTVFALPKASRTGFDCKHKNKQYMFN